MIGRRCSLSAVIGCAIGALLPVSVVIATALPSLSLMAGRELPLFLPSAIESARVVGDDVATVSIEGKRLSIKGTRPGSTQVNLQLSGESSPRTFVVKVEAAQDGGRLLVSPTSSADQSARLQEGMLPHPENDSAQTRSSHSDIQITSKPLSPQDAGNPQQSLNDAGVQRDQSPRQEPIQTSPSATAIAPASTTNTSKSDSSQSLAYVQPLPKAQGKDRLQKEESITPGPSDTGAAPEQGRGAHADGGTASHSIKNQSVFPEPVAAEPARLQEVVLPHQENHLAQTRSSHSDIQITSKSPLLQGAAHVQRKISDAGVQRDRSPRRDPMEPPPSATVIAPATATNTSKSEPSQPIAYVQPLPKDQGEQRRQKEESITPGPSDAGTATVYGREEHAEGGVGPGGVTLLQAVNRGLALHPDVKSAMAKVEQFTTEVAIAEGGYFPSLEASAGPTKSMSGDLSYNYNLTATQMLYDWGRVESQVDSASANLRQQTEALLVMREDAALDISEIYLDVLTYRQKIKTVRGQIERLKELNELGRQRGEAGYMDRSELGRVGLELARAHEQLAKEQGNLQNAVRQYQELTGEPPAALEEPALEAFSGRLADKDQLERAITASPLYRQATEKTAIEEANVHQADAALLPQLDLEGSLLRRPLGGEMTDDAIIGLRVRIEPFQGLSNFQRTDAARQRLEAAKWDVGTSQRDIRRKVLSLIETESALKWREPALKEQIKNAGDVSAVYREQFVVGLRTMNELLNIFLEHFEAERQLIDLQYERKRVQYRAAAQLGQLVPLLEGRLSETVTP